MVNGDLFRHAEELIRQAKAMSLDAPGSAFTRSVLFRSAGHALLALADLELLADPRVTGIVPPQEQRHCPTCFSVRRTFQNRPEGCSDPWHGEAL